jgi:hypothetical protein
LIKKYGEILSLFAFALFWRLCHARVLWIEEAYPMTAAIQMLAGRWPYADFWYDKPPGAAWFYLLWGALPGWPLRLAGALYVTLCAWLAGRMGGRWAAWMMAVYLSLGIPATVMALAPDLLLVAPHLAAVWMAQTRRPIAAGLISGLALLIHTKAVFVLAAVLLWASPLPALAAFAATLPVHALFGAAYWEQVWRWGSVYSGNTFVLKPVAEFFKRSGNWMGFHAAAVLGAALSGSAWRWWVWSGLCLLSVVLGLRFFPRYYFFLLPPLVVMAGLALQQVTPRWRYALLLLLLIPVIRFGPRNLRLGLGDEAWDDLALFRDSRQVADFIRTSAAEKDTLFVWGYRPDIDALSRLPGGTPYLESQPIDCVFADRHLREMKPMAGVGCEERARRLRDYEPNWIVDGLGPSNIRLRLELYYPLSGYSLVLRTPTAYVYKLISPQNRMQEAGHPANPAGGVLRAAANHPAGR